MKEIVSRLHESRQIELAKSILENAGYKVTKKEEIAEGLFDNKKKKQQEYNKLIQEVFEGSVHRITSELVDLISDICGKIAVEYSSDNKKQSHVEDNVVTVIINEIKKSPESIFNVLHNIANKHGLYQVYAEPIKEYKDKFSTLQKEGDKRGKNLGYDARNYLFKKIGELIIPQLQRLEKLFKNNAR